MWYGKKVGGPMVYGFGAWPFDAPQTDYFTDLDDDEKPPAPPAPPDVLLIPGPGERVIQLEN
jgi:hypothetical protein